MYVTTRSVIMLLMIPNINVIRLLSFFPHFYLSLNSLQLLEYGTFQGKNLGLAQYFC